MTAMKENMANSTINPHIHIKLGTPFKQKREIIEKELSEVLKKIIPNLEDIVK